jgi:hypothetical protein
VINLNVYDPLLLNLTNTNDNNNSSINNNNTNKINNLLINNSNNSLEPEDPIMIRTVARRISDLVPGFLGSGRTEFPVPTTKSDPLRNALLAEKKKSNLNPFRKKVGNRIPKLVLFKKYLFRDGSKKV